MEKIQTINEYIAAEMGGKIVRKRKSPLAGLLLIAVGVALMVLMHTSHMADSLQAAALTVGLICLALGLVLTAMALSGALWCYRYVATGSKLKEKKVYLGVDDYNKAAEALKGGDKGALGNLKAVVSSNGALHVLRSMDGSIALLQAGRFDTGHFEAETPVMVLVGTEVAAIESLCK